MPVTSNYSDGVPTVSYCVMDLSGTVLAARNAEARLYAASTIKLGVLVAALQQVEQGKLSLELELVCRYTFASGVDGAGEFGFDPDEVDLGMAAAGELVSLRQTLRRMITVSSNEATNMVVELIGLPAVNEAFRRCGATDSRMERLIGDLASRGAGRTCEVTARDLAAVVRAIVSGDAAGPAETDLMVEFLRAQEIGIIGQGLPDGIEWGSKSGWVDGIRHDVAYMRRAGAADGCVLAVCTRGYQQDEADEIIQTVGALSAGLLWAG